MIALAVSHHRRALPLRRYCVHLQESAQVAMRGGGRTKQWISHSLRKRKLVVRAEVLFVVVEQYIRVCCPSQTG